MNYLEAVVEIKNIVDSHFIKRTISLIDKKALKDLTIRIGLDKNIRNVKGYSLDLNNKNDIPTWNYIKKEIEKLYTYYKIKFPMMASDKINQIDLLKYSTGGKYKIHTDHFTNAPRHLRIIINLNDDYEGGDLIFTDQKEQEVKRLKLSKGSIVFFPSNFLYPHSIQPITKGTRYSIVAWLQ